MLEQEHEKQRNNNRDIQNKLIKVIQMTTSKVAFYEIALKSYACVLQIQS
jgi:hypothetical protein